MNQYSADIGYLQNDFGNTGSFSSFPLTNEMIDLDYDAGSIGLDFAGPVAVDRLELMPIAPFNELIGIRFESLQASTTNTTLPSKAGTSWTATVSWRSLLRHPLIPVT